MAMESLIERAALIVLLIVDCVFAGTLLFLWDLLLRLTRREPPGEICFFFEKKREFMTKKSDGPPMRVNC